MYKILLFLLLSTVATAQNVVRMATASSTDTYTAAFNPPLTSFNPSTLYVVTFVNANTSTTVTLNPDGVVGATAIKDNAGNDLAVGAIVAGGTYALKFNGTNLRIAGSTATGSSTSTADAAILAVETTSVGNVGTGEDVLWSYTLPADTLNTNGEFIRGRISGIFALNDNDKTIRLKFGSTTIATRLAINTPSIGQGYLLDWEVIRTGATTQKCNAVFSGIDGVAAAFYTATGETLSGTVDIVLTGEATSNDDILMHSSIVTWGFGGGIGSGGGSGDLSEVDLVVSETPSGTVNGSNVTFTLANTPTSFVHVYLDGLLQVVGGGNDYTISGATITFVAAPLTGSRVRVSYIK